MIDAQIQAPPIDQPTVPDSPASVAFATPLTAHDRCDVGACGAQAYVRVGFATGDLLFCAHHYNAHNSRSTLLQSTSITIHDERSRLSDKRLDVSA